MDIHKLLNKYMREGRVMQVATEQDGQPWVCSVYFVAEDTRHIYWLSVPESRHSQEIVLNPKVAITIAVKTDLPVIGVQAEGTAEEVEDESEVARVMGLYVKRHGTGAKFYDNFVAGKNQHHMYRFSPQRIQLFDEVNFAKDDIQEIIL